MPKNSFISDADHTLASLLWKSLQEENAKNLIASQEQIIFSNPKASKPQAAKLTIFLYNITKGTAEKDGPLTLHYLVTPCTGNDRDDHSLLEKIVQALSPPHADAGSGFTVKVESLSLDELSQLWTALDAPLRLSVSLTVSSVEPQSETQAPAPQPAVFVDSRVSELYQSVLKIFNEQAEGWRSGNMFVKQWVFQNFQKVTELTVQEMQNELKNLGERLEKDEPVGEFVKPLGQLGAYYQHQLDGLKGLDKVSRKQKDNIEMIKSWLSDVKALIDALGKS